MTIRVGFLGAGTVGGSLLRRLVEQNDAIATKSGVELDVHRVAVRDVGKARDVALGDGVLTADPRDVVTDPDVDLVVEVMGGLDPAGDLVLAALQSGKPVVTANKALIAARGRELIEAAEAAGVSLLFEAAVGGGIPIIRPLSQSLAGEQITRVMGIVNGTTNFILTKMIEDGLPYHGVLAEAQELGYAEADPTADVSGADAAAKAAILASLAFGIWVGFDRVHHEGIDQLEQIDFEFAANLGYRPKLLAIAEQGPGGIAVRVHPALVPSEHPLASVRGATNAVFVEGPAIGELLFTGPGAGGDPTATAVLGDVLHAARELLAKTPAKAPIRFAPGTIVEFDDVATKWYLRLEVADRPGVLARIASTFGDHRVSIKSVWQEGRGDRATLLLVTHDALERDLRAARAALDGLEVVGQVAAVIRVQSDEP
jgi:homoserine dehydrogenase